MSVQSFSSDETPGGRGAAQAEASSLDWETSDDGVLVRAACDGTSSAFDALVRRYADRLLRMVCHLTASREDAEDVTQEALAAAYFKLDTFAGRSSFFTWLYRIALNKAISRRRLRRFETTHEGRPLDDAPPTSDNQPSVTTIVQRDEDLQHLRAAIARLDPERRAVLVLRDVDARDYSEIAEILNIPVGTVRSRLHRARCDLRRMLECDFPTDGGGASA